LAEELKQEFGLEATLIASDGGVFEVMYGEELIYSKAATSRHAEPGEVATLIRQRNG
jgi:selenoprotein W-related protein